MRSLSEVTAIDFDWPKRFWNSLSEQDQANFIRYVQAFQGSLRWLILCDSNVVGHLGTVVSTSVRQRQVALFALVDASLGQAIAKGVGVSVPPLPTFPSGPTWLNTTVESNSSTLNY